MPMEAHKENTYGIHITESVFKKSARDDYKNNPKKI